MTKVQVPMVQTTFEPGIVYKKKQKNYRNCYMLCHVEDAITCRMCQVGIIKGRVFDEIPALNEVL